ncbi:MULTISPECIES: DNA polymerase Y family protein [unclassified Mesorhizobium]|uniref:Y-family DNA polymerase n=1 Tax=unclassified Mesorhizobium TaxID=325217 RepID=UPI000FCB5EF1|nr:MULTISPECIES: DNA polymerase Y family protein [unclassified Mesorhizobium]RUX91296.1 DNA polymerase Y family protein [Mesorhizobium sp. M7D.F.Ca.US.004.01.2.1]RVA36919.1 DNA polymerase Y family protein [Mesorhizobium sp. M7D.F.Ca.US.004.03.1.1]
MPRVVSLFLPSWSTDRLRRKLGDVSPPPDKPMVLVGRQGNRRLVVAADRAALEAGLRVGMPATKAQALVQGLVVMDAEPDADAEALERLALWALRRYAPMVAVDPPDGLVMDTMGADHLHGGEQMMLTDMVERLSQVGFSARAAIADSWGAAHAVARYVNRTVSLVTVNATCEAILPLPIAALRLPDAIVGGLRVLGFDRVGELLKQPRAPLTLRFGPELCRRLDQAAGRLSEPIEPVRPAEMVEVKRAFGEPIGAAETIARYVGKLVQALSIELETKGLGARRLDLLLYRVDNRIEAIRVGTALPVRDVKRLTRLLCDKIETVDPGFGIELISLSAPLAEPLTPRQTISSLIEQRDTDISDLIDILGNRVGEEMLYRFTPVASDVPERSFRRVAPASAETGDAWPDHWPRPARLFAVPELIEAIALLPDHPPASFTLRGIRRRVKRADGPERVFGEWWKRDAELAAVRDYFQVEDEAGERFWIYRAGDGEDAGTGSHRWFLHGIFG